MTENKQYGMINTRDGGGKMDLLMNKEMMIRINADNVDYIKTLDKIEECQLNWPKIDLIGLFVLKEEKMFINKEAKKIFINILIDSCEFIPELKISQENELEVIIDTREISYSRCLEIIEMIRLMIERANDISDVITNGVVKEKVNQNFLTKYKMLIEGLKSTYEKGLILVRLLFKDHIANGLLSKYYRLIQKKESFDTRKEIFYDLLLTGNESIVINNVVCKNRKR